MQQKYLYNYPIAIRCLTSKIQNTRAFAEIRMHGAASGQPKKKEKPSW
jgi:hypothetical protein